MNETTTASAEALFANPDILDPTEVHLTAEIEQLWQVHSNAQTSPQQEPCRSLGCPR
jgi:hypothetical protein